MNAVAVAHPNMALVKYWGKRDEALLLPQNSSISVTMGGLEARAHVGFSPDLDQDSATLNGEPVARAALVKVVRCLDALRHRAGLDHRAQVASTSDFPVAAGLASSAAGFAAIARAGAAALGLEIDPTDLSGIARLGSGSAARSIHGGYVEWVAGEAPDGSDSVGRQLFPAGHWDLSLVVAVAEAGKKSISSTDGMRRTVETSPYYAGWLVSVEQDLARVRAALAERDIEALGRAAEANCLRMHALMLSTNPPIVYWTPGTVAAMETVSRLREDGFPVFFTIDAGPNVTAMCPKECAVAVEAALSATEGIQAVLSCGVGGPARVMPGA